MNPSNSTTIIQLASRKRRIAAFAIDHMIMSFLLVMGIFLSMGPNFMNEPSFLNMFSSIIFGTMIGMMIYVCKDVIKGRSLGKWALGIAVRDANDQDKTPSVGRLILRNLFIVIWPVEFIILATNQDKKRLGDTVAKTVVIRSPKPIKVLPVALVLGTIAIGLFVSFMMFMANTMKNSDAYKTAIAGIEQHEKVNEVTGGITGYGFMPLGNINISNGYGHAHLTISVKGVNEDVKVNARLEKLPGGEWKLLEVW